MPMPFGSNGFLLKKIKIQRQNFFYKNEKKKRKKIIVCLGKEKQFLICLLKDLAFDSMAEVLIHQEKIFFSALFPYLQTRNLYFSVYI